MCRRVTYSGDLPKAQGCPAGRLEIPDRGEAAFLHALPRQQPSWERPRVGGRAGQSSTGTTTCTEHRSWKHCSIAFFFLYTYPEMKSGSCSFKFLFGNNLKLSIKSTWTVQRTPLLLLHLLYHLLCFSDLCEINLHTSYIFTIKFSNVCFQLDYVT